MTSNNGHDAHAETGLSHLEIIFTNPFDSKLAEKIKRICGLPGDLPVERYEGGGGRMSGPSIMDDVTAYRSLTSAFGAKHVQLGFGSQNTVLVNPVGYKYKDSPEPRH